MDAKQRRAVIREMERLGVIQRPEVKTERVSVQEDSFKSRVIAFFEHPLFLVVFGIIGGIVALIFTPFLFITVFCILGAFHRAHVVVSKDRPIQITAYVILFAVSSGGVYEVTQLIKSSVQIPKAHEIAVEIRSMLPASQVNNFYAATGSPSLNGTVILKEHSYVAFIGLPHMGMQGMLGGLLPHVEVTWVNSGPTPIELERLDISAETVSLIQAANKDPSFIQAKFRHLLNLKNPPERRRVEVNQPIVTRVPISGLAQTQMSEEMGRIQGGEDTVLFLVHLVYKDDLGNQPPIDKCFFLMPEKLAAQAKVPSEDFWWPCPSDLTDSAK